jgi:hypothetical protein
VYVGDLRGRRLLVRGEREKWRRGRQEKSRENHRVRREKNGRTRQKAMFKARMSRVRATWIRVQELP